MIEIRLVPDNDKQELINIITNPSLFKLTYGQGMKAKDFELESDYIYVGIYLDNLLIGTFQIRPLTKVTIDCHIYILPKYWGTGTSVTAVRKAHQWLLETTPYRTMLITVPESCKHIMKFMQNIDYKCCGSIPNGIIYNNKVNDLVLFSHTLINR